MKIKRNKVIELIDVQNGIFDVSTNTNNQLCIKIPAKVHSWEKPEDKEGHYASFPKFLVNEIPDLIEILLEVKKIYKL